MAGALYSTPNWFGTVCPNAAPVALRPAALRRTLPVLELPQSP